MANAASPRKSSSREIKRERLELRVAASSKTLIQRAMAISGMTAGEIATEGARRVLESHERMELAGADAEAFLAALTSPPEPTPRLIEALRSHRALSA